MRVFGSIIVFGGTFADIVAAIVTMRAARKKRYRRMRKGILTMFIMSIMVLVVYYGAKMITFSTLNQAMRVYGIKDQKVQVVYGEHSAMAPYEGLTDISLEIFSEKNGRWKMPYGNSDQILESGMADSQSVGLSIFIYWYANEQGRYIVVQDYSSGYRDEKTVADSEQTEFLTYCTGESNILPNRAYYGYLAEVPENYKLTLDGREVQVDWKELFYPMESAQE